MKKAILSNMFYLKMMMRNFLCVAHIKSLSFFCTMLNKLKVDKKMKSTQHCCMLHARESKFNKVGLEI